jgi:hypothetical protein
MLPLFVRLKDSLFIDFVTLSKESKAYHHPEYQLFRDIELVFVM